jgi:hypothetical protein
MRHHGRKYILGVVSAVGVIAFAIAPAAGVAKSKKPSAKPSLVKCTAMLTLQIPANQDQVLPGQTPGQQSGSIRCAKGIGGGLEAFSYKIPTSGDEVGSFVAFFKNGTIKGKFDLVPQEGSFGNGSSATFGASAFEGTVKHLSGTGVWAAAKGAGTAKCSSQDGLHFTCVEKL